MVRPIQLHLDLAVDPAKEQQMLKLRSAVVGTAPPGVSYRFSLAYESEELRQRWVASDVHASVWGELERTFSSNDYSVLIFDVA